ncbi:intraflagellar transport protein 25 homolog isoform X2 [Lethenteron reissneri]|uniref:intraflagellar transport protein 25 homolog isoform X2 n=1 Tax=Lethenteron reissneri TaxID=7753 RepID=UPI002AB7B95C|nr:intraflagellar transport protein 25 homolog isoform X2 [Lethenteron reissneri]
MEDVALSSAGARVSLATSSDERHPAENVTDGSSSTFWMSTGTFPQEFIITLADVTSIQSMRIECYNELEHNESNLQTEDINVKIVQAQHLRFIIRSAYDHFTSVHRVSVAGNIQHR